MKQKRFGSKKKSLIISVVIVMLMLIGITIYSIYSENKATKNHTILQVNSNELAKDNVTLAIVAVDEKGNETTLDDFPTDGYVFDYLKSNCKNGSIINFNSETGTASITTSSKDSCLFYFRKPLGDLAENIIAKAQKNGYLEKENPTYSTVTTNNEYGMYSATDDLGTSYYFRGDVENNYVKFGTYSEATTFTIYDNSDWTEKTITIANGSQMYWRIVRINGDGTIRLIYDGTSKIANGNNHDATIGHTAYNPIASTKGVGYTYDDGSGTQTDSYAKEVLDAWYVKHLKTKYGSYISDSIFCNDRVSTIADNGNTYYAPYDRLVNNKKPALTCTNKSDRYTVNDTTNGNGYLSNPIGLITADEAIMAGGTSSIANNSYYLYTGEKYWALSPSYFASNNAYVYTIRADGRLYSDSASNVIPGARPVINLKADVKFTGDGSYETPYTIVTN